MTKNQMALAAKMLDDYADRLGNDCCNDFDFPDEWSEVEIKHFVKDYHDWNRDPEEFDESCLQLPNFAVAAFLAHLINKP